MRDGFRKAAAEGVFARFTTVADPYSRQCYSS
jgi:hypothetical protein